MVHRRDRPKVVNVKLVKPIRAVAPIQADKELGRPLAGLREPVNKQVRHQDPIATIVQAVVTGVKPGAVEVVAIRMAIDLPKALS
jgi:hypothetical protein